MTSEQIIYVEILSDGRYAYTKEDFEALKKSFISEGMEEAAKLCDEMRMIVSDICATKIREAKDKL